MEAIVGRCAGEGVQLVERESQLRGQGSNGEELWRRRAALLNAANGLDRDASTASNDLGRATGSPAGLSQARGQNLPAALGGRI